MIDVGLDRNLSAAGRAPNPAPFADLDMFDMFQVLPVFVRPIGREGAVYSNEVERENVLGIV